MADTLNTIVPIILIVIGVIWLWATFGEPMKRFIEWIKGFMGSQKDRFQPRNLNVPTEFKYS